MSNATILVLYTLLVTAAAVGVYFIVHSWLDYINRAIEQEVESRNGRKT